MGVVSALVMAGVALVLSIIALAGLIWLGVDYLAGKKATHQITMLNPYNGKLEDLDLAGENDLDDVAKDFSIPRAPEDQMGIPPVPEAARRAFEQATDEEYDNIT